MFYSLFLSLIFSFGYNKIMLYYVMLYIQIHTYILIYTHIYIHTYTVYRRLVKGWLVNGRLIKDDWSSGQFVNGQLVKNPSNEEINVRHCETY